MLPFLDKIFIPKTLPLPTLLLSLPLRYRPKTKIAKQCLTSSGLVIAVALAGLSLQPLIEYKVVAFLLLVTVSILAMFFELVPVLTAAVLSALIWGYFFIPPRFTFTIATAEDRILLVMYFVIASVIGVLTYKIGKMKQNANATEEKIKSVKFYDTMLNSLSHELRTPITTILGCTDNLQNNSKQISDDDKADLINEISIASIRLNQQVENLLNMSRLESGVFQIKKDWTDVSDVIYKTLHRLDANLEKYTVAVEIPDGLPLFKLDFGLMEQVVYNLIINVTQHTPENTRITIQANCVRDKLILTIADNGHGFPENEINKVFYKFYRLKGSAVGGTGLGLSIVKGFVEAHHGVIELANLPVCGSRFTIEIPTEKSYVNRQKDE